MSTKENAQFNKLILLQLLNFSHFFDEYFFGFPEWATKHFGTTGKNYYLLSHLPLVLIIGVIMWGMHKGSRVALFFALGVQTIFFTNGIFHIITTILWYEYSPGLMTQVIILPSFFITLKLILDSKVLSKKQVAHSLIIGTTVSILLILSLFLNMPV